MALTETEKERYLRQLSIQDWDQERLKSAKVLIVGLGGLGSASAHYLTVAGVGRIRICEGELVERSNLNRQILYTEDSIGKPKIEVAGKRLASINPDVKIEIEKEIIDGGNAEEKTKNCDLIVDGLDNVESRFILNEQCVKKEIPYVYGAVEGWQGMVGLFHPPHTACLACFFPQDFRRKDMILVPGIIPGFIGLLQASETIKFIMGVETPLLGRLLIYNSRNLTFDIIEIEKNTNCPHCSVLRKKT